VDHPDRLRKGRQAWRAAYGLALSRITVTCSESLSDETLAEDIVDALQDSNLPANPGLEITETSPSTSSA